MLPHVLANLERMGALFARSAFLIPGKWVGGCDARASGTLVRRPSWRDGAGAG